MLTQYGSHTAEVMVLIHVAGGGGTMDKPRG